MAKSGRRTAADAGIGGNSEGGGAAHKMQLRRRSALGDISSAVSNGSHAGGAQGKGAGAAAGGRKPVREGARSVAWPREHTSHTLTLSPRTLGILSRAGFILLLRLHSFIKVNLESDKTLL